MSNVNNITSKILKDAEVRKESILAAAEEEKKEILSKQINNAKDAEKEILDRATLEAKSKKERVISSAKLKVRNEKLAQKQSIIEEIFEKSIEKLTSLSQEEYLTFVKNSILSMNLDGDETLILNRYGSYAINDAFMNEINAALKAKGLKGEIRVSEVAGNFKGGFILEKNGIEINNTYEALVSSLRDELEFEVAKVLFS